MTSGAHGGKLYARTIDGFSEAMCASFCRSNPLCTHYSFRKNAGDLTNGCIATRGCGKDSGMFGNWGGSTIEYSVIKRKKCTPKALIDGVEREILPATIKHIPGFILTKPLLGGEFPWVCFMDRYGRRLKVGKLTYGGAETDTNAYVSLADADN